MRVLLVVCVLLLVSSAAAINVNTLAKELSPANGVTHSVNTNADGSITVTATASTTATVPAAAGATAVNPPQVGAAAAATELPPNDDADLVPEHEDVEEAFIPFVGAAASRCASARGVCQNSSSRCAGSYQSGLCPGASSIRCCLPAGAAAAPAAAAPAAAGGCKRAALAARARSGAQARSSGYCARYVGNAIQGVGLRYTRVNSAKDAGRSLLAAGFEAVGNTYQDGDVVVMQNFGTHRHGHIQIYAGGRWYSDFAQNNFWPGSSYASARPRTQNYRLRC